MSEQFENKEYGEYFNALEQRINSPAKSYKNSGLESEKTKKKIKLRKSTFAVLALLVAVVIGVTVFAVSGKDSEKQNDSPKAQQLVEREEEKVSKIAFTSNSKTVEISADSDAKAVILVDLKTKKVIAQRNAHERLYPASTTKIMTLIVAVENIKNMDDTFTMSYAVTDPLYIAGASSAGFLNNEEITMLDLLYGTILPSGADAAMGLALKVAGSEEAFVSLMNEKVKELGLSNTHFTNVSGLHNEENYSTAYDMAVILAAAMENETCYKVLSTYKHTTRVTEQHPQGISLSSTLFNHMYGTEPETATILGGKTGYISESGYCIATFGKSNKSGNKYVAVTLGNSSRVPAFSQQINLYKDFVK